ncbi:MAG: YfhO family protein [Deltaproteobacteria bacterium]|nr:YfhO family protein [Deltaproteobacteria bacterium]
MFLSCALAGWFCALLFRSWGCGGFAASTGGILFVFACMLGQTYWPPAVSTILWLPWILLCIEKLGRGWSPGWWAGLALGAALQILAGFPQYLVYSYYLVLPFAALRVLEGSGGLREKLLGRALPIAGALALAVGLSGMQLVPSLELVGQSARSEALTAEEIHYLHPATDPFPASVMLRNAVDPSPKLISLHFAWGSGYLGISALVLLAVGVAASLRKPLGWLLLCVGALTLLLADGYQGATPGLYRLYAELPLVGSFRVPQRMHLVTFFCAIALATLGFHELGRDDLDAKRRLGLVVLVASAAVLAAMDAAGTASGAWRLGLTLILALGLLRWSGRSRVRWLGQALLLALVVVDLGLATERSGSLRQLPETYARHFRPASWIFRPEFRTAPPDGFISPRRLEALRREHGLNRVEVVGFIPDAAAAPSNALYRISCHEPLTLSQWSTLHRKLTGGAQGAVMGQLDPRLFPAVYDVASVQRILSWNDSKSRVETLINPDAVPRAYLVDHHRIAEQREAFERIARADVDFKQTVLLEREPTLATSTPLGGGRHEASITAYAPERVAITVQAARPALLVLTDTHYPGWQAHIDGEPAETLRANGLFRAVGVPDGRHEVIFEYRPASFRWGVRLSLAAALLLAGIVLTTARRRSGPRRAHAT